MNTIQILLGTHFTQGHIIYINYGVQGTHKIQNKHFRIYFHCTFNTIMTVLCYITQI